MTTLKLTPEQIDFQAQAIIDAGPQAFGEVQSTIYAMIGGGMLGNSAIRQPADFYIDNRVDRRLPYSATAILQTVRILERAAFLGQVRMESREIPDFRTFKLNLGVY